MTSYTEDRLVQKTVADYLEKPLGWDSIYAYNKEDFGPAGLLGRHTEKEVVLTRILREKIIQFNPDLPDEVYDDVISQITSSPASQTITAINREKHEIFREGVKVKYHNKKGEPKQARLRMFDFTNPAENSFICVRELWIKGDLYRRRADIIGFVNGLPLIFVELKNIHKDLKIAFESNYSDYLDTIPHLFHYNAIVMVGNGEKAKIGSITSKWDHFHEWKRLAEDEPGVVDMQTLLKGICKKENFIDLLENFIFFDDSSGESRKIIARNHQFLGVNKAIEAVRERKTRDGKLGVFWHTQGAGKSYSIVMFTRKAHRKLGGNFTFLILTDRDDLDTQIYKTFAGCGTVDNDRDPCRASSGENLRQLLSEQKSHVFSLIQKFNQEVDPENAYSQREDIIVITDEAHRTQYGMLALNMRNALPNASYIGFTGTPLFKDDEITRRVFGEYISTYDFQRAVEDKATVPLYYDARGDKLGVAIKDLNEKLAAKLEELKDVDIDEQQRLEKDIRRDYHVITADKRLNQVANDFVHHYSTSWETGKAMVVCIDKITCVKMFNLVTEKWELRIEELRSDLQKTTDEQEEIYLKRQIDWMQKTQTAVIVSEEQGEIERFKKWDLDIVPHRELIKKGIDLPELMRDKPQFQNMQRMELDEAFKVEEHPFRIAIVCAMWLTGFDVPSLSTLYLDKPLKAHTLMQAIARANRINEGKNNGLVVDYCGILKNLRKALADFAGTPGGGGGGGGGGGPAKPNEELLKELAEAIAMVRTNLANGGVPLDNVIKSSGFDQIAAIVAAKEVVNENDETRKRFEVMCREVFKKFKACINIKEVNDYRNDRNAINIIYKKLQEDRDKADISEIIKQLHEIVDSAIDINPEANGKESKVYDISNIDFDRLRKEFERSPKKNTTIQSLKQVIEQKLLRLLSQNPLRTDFQEHYEQIVKDYNSEKDKVTIEQTFEELLRYAQGLDEEEGRAVREGLDDESLALYDLLKKKDLNTSETIRIKSVAVDLLAKLKEEKLRVDQWREKEATRDAVRIMIQDFLWSDDTGLPVDAYTEDDVVAKTEEVFRHIFRVYSTLPSPFYADTEVA